MWLEDAPVAHGHASALAGEAGVKPLAELEREAILHALEVVGGNRRRPPSCSASASARSTTA